MSRRTLSDSTGWISDATRAFGQMCLAARRLVERGVRFVQIFHGTNGGAGAWDAHGGLRQNHAAQCAQVDRPIAGLAHRSEAARAARRDDRRLGDRVRPHARARKEATAATIIRSASRSGWPAAASREASPTARPTSSASTPSKTATTSPTSTPRCCTSLASTRAGSRFPATSGWKSTSANRSGRSSPEELVIDLRASTTTILHGSGHGLSGVALAAMLERDGFGQGDGDGARATAWKPPDGRPHFAPKAKNVIWLFMIGGTSHVESFDPKPALNRYAGKTIAETPFAGALKNKLSGNLRVLLQDQPELHIRRSLYPLQVGYRKRGEAGIEISDWWPHLGSCIDDTCRHPLDVDDRQRPRGTASIPHRPAHARGAVSHDRLVGPLWPRVARTTTCRASSCSARRLPIAAADWGATARSYLGPEHDGIQLSVDPRNPLPFATPARDVFREEQAGEFELLGRLNRLSAARYPDDPALRARIKSYELAFRMQTAVPEVMQLSGEPAAIAASVRAGPGCDPRLRADVPFGPAAGRARRAVRADLPRVQRRRRRLGCSQRLAAEPRRPVCARSTGRSRGCSPI